MMSLGEAKTGFPSIIYKIVFAFMKSFIRCKQKNNLNKKI
jgi:hypothetical protein